MNTRELQLVTYEQKKRLEKLGCSLFWIKSYVPILWYNDEGTLCTLNYYPYPAEYSSIPTVALALQYFEQEKGIKYSTELVYKFNGIWKYKWKYIIGSDCNMSNETFETLQSTKNALLDELLTVFEEEK
jgi:hypothetical protein